MRVIFGTERVPTFVNAVATMGSYDGVHSGHREILHQVMEIAKQCGGESVVITFEPHPRYVLGSGESLKLLNSVEEKVLLLEELGIDNLVIIPFTTEFSHKSPEAFIKENIIALGIKSLVVGYNHRFGHKKEGNYDYLETQCKELNIVRVEQHQVAQSKVSSTIVRQLISKGLMRRAAQLLSSPYILKCKIEDNGVATILNQHKLLPPPGRYRVLINESESYAEIIGNKVRIEQATNSGETIIKFIE